MMTDEECQCVCHKHSNTMHMVACCITCDVCGKHITHHCYKEHRERHVANLQQSINTIKPYNDPSNRLRNNRY
jgi:hypothetical protein